MALILAVATTSWGSILARLCVSHPLTVSFHRLLLATLLLLATVPPRLPRGTGGKALRASIAAGLLLALHFASWIGSLRFTTIAASTLLVSTQPLFSALLSWRFLGEPPSRRGLAGILLAFAGVALVAGFDGRAGADRLKGDALAVLGAVCAAAYLVVGRAARDVAPFRTYLALVNGAGAVAAGLLAVLAGVPLRPAIAGDWLWLALMAAGPHVLGHGALNFAVRRLPAWMANLPVLGEPVLASLLAYRIFAEVPPAGALPGALLIAAGVVLAARASAPRATL
ncbi:MAG: DMT family transporter [Candidatus Polarisedimenticolia bacterium]